MKRASLFLAVLILLLYGCQNINEKDIYSAVASPFEEKKIIMSFFEKQFDGSLKRDLNGHTVLSLKSKNMPDEIIFYDDGETNTAEFKELKIKREKFYCPSSIIYDSFFRLSKGKIEKRKEDIIISSLPFEAVIDKEAKKLLRINFPEGYIIFLS